MRVALLCCCLLLACTQKPSAPYVDDGSNLVKVVADPPIVFPDPPAPATFETPAEVDGASQVPQAIIAIRPTLVTEPLNTTQVSELREVHVTVDVSGVDPSELALEFVSPEGDVFERQTARLTERRTVAQSVEFLLPVAGTLIASTQRVGTWQARLFHDGAPVQTLSFEVTP